MITSKPITNQSIRPNAGVLASAIRVEVVSIIWMFVEGVGSVYAGLVAHSTSLIAFGADSGVELIAGAVLLWRLQTQRTGSEMAVDKAEKTAAWVTTVALAGLCLYIAIASAYGLLRKTAQGISPLGITISIVALIIMLPIAKKKGSLALLLNSASLKADAACSYTCAYLAAALLFGLLLNALTGWWWTDSVLSLVFLVWLIKETREAFQGARRGELHCDC